MGGKSNLLDFSVRRGSNVTDINKAFTEEEKSRVEKADNDPDSKQIRIRSIRNALPIKDIQNLLVDAVKSQDQVVIVSATPGRENHRNVPNISSKIL